MHSNSFRRLNDDGAIDYRRILVTGIFITGDAEDETVSIYDGQDANSGILFHTLRTQITGTNPVVFPVPIRFERGMYLVLGTGIVEVTVTYMPCNADGSITEYIGVDSANG